MTLIFSRNFDEELDQELNGIKKECNCVYPSQSEIDSLVEEAKADAFRLGHDEGYSKGLEDGREEADLAQKAVLADIKIQLNKIFLETNRNTIALEAQVLDFTLSICESVFPYLQYSQSHERALQKIKDTMRLALGSPYINVSVSETALPKLTPFTDEISADLGLTEQIIIKADKRLRDGSAHIEWKNGFRDYNFDLVCDQILMALKNAQANSSNPLMNGNKEND